MADKQKIGYIRTDDDGYWYLVPEKDLDAFDKKWYELLDASVTDDDTYDTVENEFVLNFDKYRLRGGIEGLKVIIDEGVYLYGRN